MAVSYLLLATALIVLVLLAGCEDARTAATPVSPVQTPSDQGSLAGTPAVSTPAPVSPTALVGSGGVPISPANVTRVERLHTLFGSSMAFSPDSTLLALGSQDGTITLWDVKSRKIVRTIQGPSTGVWGVLFSPDGALLGAAVGDSARIYALESGDQLATVGGQGQYLLCGGFSPDGRLLATGGEDHTVKIWDTSAWQELHTLRGHTGVVFSVDFSPDGRLLASASGRPDFSVKLWDVESGEVVRTLDAHTADVHDLAFSPDGTRLVSGGIDREVRLWDVESGEVLRSFRGHRDVVYGLAYSPAGDMVAAAAGEDRVVIVWEVESGRLLHKLQGHSGEVATVAFSPDGLLLASGSVDQEVLLWGISPAGATPASDAPATRALIGTPLALE